jgi:hypothetical protein
VRALDGCGEGEGEGEGDGVTLALSTATAFPDTLTMATAFPSETGFPNETASPNERTRHKGGFWEMVTPTGFEPVLPG